MSTTTRVAASWLSGTTSPPPDYTTGPFTGCLLLQLAAVHRQPATHPRADHAHREVDKLPRIAGDLPQRHAPLVRPAPRVERLQPQRRIAVPEQRLVLIDRPLRIHRRLSE